MHESNDSNTDLYKEINANKRKKFHGFDRKKSSDPSPGLNKSINLNDEFNIKLK